MDCTGVNNCGSCECRCAAVFCVRKQFAAKWIRKELFADWMITKNKRKELFADG